MKNSLLLLSFLTFSFGTIAQQTTTTPAKQPTRQELYDQYHSQDATKKGDKKADKKSGNMDAAPKKAAEPKPERAARTSASSGDEHSRFGIRGGLNLANISGGTTSYDMLLGFHGGILYNIAVSDAFSIQPELLYTVKGAKFSGTDVKANVIELPLLFKYKFGESSTKFFINGGGYGGYLLDVNGTKPTDTTIEYGLVGGAGVELGAGSGKLLIEGRYNYGMGYTNTKTFTKTDEHITVLGISVAYLF